MSEGQFVSDLFAKDANLLVGFVVLLSALLLSRLAPLPRELQPMVWFGVLARELAHKVNHPKRDRRQQMTAGLLSALLLILPFWLIVVFLLQLAEFPWFFDAIVLYVCLSDAPFTKVADEVRLLVIQGKKEQAKKLLSQYVSRDTIELSEVGIAKTVIEKLVTSQIYGIASTVFFFALAGAPMVLMVRMLKQLEQAWPPMVPRYQAFCAPINRLVSLLLYLPALMWSFTLAMLGGPKGFKTLWSPRRKHPLSNGIRAIAVTAATLNIELGGAQKFQGERIEIDKLGFGPLPEAQHIALAIHFVNRAYVMWFGFLVFIPVTWTLLRYVQTL